MTPYIHITVRRAIVLGLLVLLGAAGCRPKQNGEAPREANQTADTNTAAQTLPASDKPIPRFAKNSPFAGDYNLPAEQQAKQIWATSFLWEKAPDLVAEKWLTPEPNVQGKYVLIEYWATWCPPCRRSIPVLNEIHRRFQDRLVVIGLSDEPEEKVRALTEPRIEYHIAVDTQARMKKAVGVKGIPHVIVVEPGGYVVWEGYPLLEGHELTAQTIEEILSAGARGRRDSQM